MKKVNLFICCLSLLLIACERYELVDVNLKFKSKVVASLIMQGDSAVGSLMLTRTTPVIGTKTADSPAYITNGEVYLTNRNVRYPFVYDSTTQRYMVDLGGTSFMPGERYDLKVITPNEVVTGSAVVPVAPQIQCTVFQESVPRNGAYYNQVRIRYTLIAPAVANIYLSPSFVNDDSSETILSNVVYNDKLVTRIKQGETLEKVYGSYYPFELPGFVARLKLKIASCDDVGASYYNKYGMEAFDGFGGPFQQPIIAISNLSNGIGILGALTLAPEQSFPIK